MKFKVGSFIKEWGAHSHLNVIFEDETASTNQIAKDLPLPSQSPLSIAVTNHQTGGRGRGSNEWQDANGDSVLMSWIFDTPQAVQPVTSILVGLACYRALKATWPFLDISLKAPNDIYLKDKKLGGLLLETVTQGQIHRLIVGFGMNIFSSPSDLPATSLSEALHTFGNDVSRQSFSDLLDRLLLELTMVVSHGQAALNKDQQQGVLSALNSRPGLPAKYDSIQADGTLKAGKKTTHWSSL